jgi:hypothetical protein
LIRSSAKGATLRVAPEFADPVGSLEVGEHEDVEQLGARSGAERVETGLESLFEVVWTHEAEPTLRPDSP